MTVKMLDSIESREFNFNNQTSHTVV